MPINKINMFEGAYMKIDKLVPSKTGITKEKEVRTERNSVNTLNEKEASQKTQDQIRISAKAIIENAKSKASSLPEIREEKVSKLREQIQNGTYQVSNRELARAMIGTLLSELA